MCKKLHPSELKTQTPLNKLFNAQIRSTQSTANCNDKIREESRFKATWPGKNWHHDENTLTREHVPGHDLNTNLKSSGWTKHSWGEGLSSESAKFKEISYSILKNYIICGLRWKKDLSISQWTTSWNLRICSCLACVYRVMDAHGKFGEHEGCNEYLEAQPRATLASWVLSKLPKCIHNSIYAQIKDWTNSFIT